MSARLSHPLRVRGHLRRSARISTVNRNLSDPQALLSSIETAGVAARVVNTPLEFIQDAEGDVASDIVARINDQLAELVRRIPAVSLGLRPWTPMAVKPGRAS